MWIPRTKLRPKTAVVQMHRRAALILPRVPHRLLHQFPLAGKLLIQQSQLALTLKHRQQLRLAADKGQKKKKGLTPEQKEKLQQIQQEQENVRKERVANLSEKLLQKISVWIETDRSEIVTEAFKTKMQVLILCLSCLTFSSMKQRF